MALADITLPGSLKTADVALRLPEPSRQKLKQLRHKRDRSYDLLRPVTDRAADARAALRKAEGRLAELEQVYRAGRLTRTEVLPTPFMERSAAGDRSLQTHASRVRPDLNRLQAARDEVEQRRETYEQLVEERGALEAEWAVRGQLIDRLEIFIAATPRDVGFEIFDGGSFRLGKGETPAAAVERVRAERAALHEELDSLRSMPRPSSEVLELATRQIDQLAGTGAADAFCLYERRGRLEWPETEVSVLGNTVDGRSVNGSALVPNTLAILCWAVRDLMVDKIAGIVKTQADDEHAIPAETRAAKSAEIAEKLLDLEYEEEHHVEAAAEQGITIERRPDCDVRAVLALSSSTPLPKRR